MLRNVFFLGLAIAGTLATSSGAATPRSTPPALLSVSVDNGGARFAGDGPLLTTISPNGDGFRDRAYVRVALAHAGVVRLEVRRGLPEVKIVETQIVRLHAGVSTLVWAPAARTKPDTYRVRLTIDGGRVGRGEPVVRIQGIDAGFTRASYRPRERAWLSIASDARSCELRYFRVGAESLRTKAPDLMRGVPVGAVQRFDHCGSRQAVVRHRVRIGAWSSGLYFARLRASGGSVGFAPFVVRPRRLGEHRIAVVEPTFTWQAYNFRDGDGNGVGDTWYADWAHHTARLGRPYLDRGVPSHFRWYDLQFLRWLSQHGHSVDMLGDEDLDTVAGAGALARAYDLIVFPGHHEYVTTHEYDAIEGFRDRGGNLMFLSANNFFWKVVRQGSKLRRIAEWRDLGRPEAALVGVQYRGNDDGRRRGAYVVCDAPHWLLDRSGLQAGSQFGHYGIEIDARATDSPPGTRLIARISDLYGPGFTAEMTYYETAAGAKVFAAGSFTIAGTAERQEVAALLDNLWARLTKP